MTIFKAMVNENGKFKGFAYGETDRELQKHVDELRKKGFKSFGKAIIK